MWNLGKCVFLLLSILLVKGFPTPKDAKCTNNDENCLEITPEIQKQIDSIVDQITKNINTISVNYDDVDLRLVEISMDRHYLEEGDKDTVLQLTINDCTNGVSQTDYHADDKHTNIAVSEEKDESTSQDKSQVGTDNTTALNDDADDNDESKSEEVVNDKNGSSDQLVNDTTEDDVLVDDIKNNYSKENSEPKPDDEGLIADFNFQHINENKNNIPDVLKLVNYNDVKMGLFIDKLDNTSKESLFLNDNDKIFFKALTKVRGTNPFVMYQRRYDNSEQYWFL